MIKSTYRGFSTQHFLESGGVTFATTDQETVKQDLLNHIYTIPGERVMLPDFGTRIPLMAFEPLDNKSLAIVEEDLRKVIAYDPRVSLIGISVNALTDNSAIVAFVDVKYIKLNVTETLKLEFPVNR